jgi:iron complex outermembrane receptor protein
MNHPRNGTPGDRQSRILGVRRLESSVLGKLFLVLSIPLCTWAALAPAPDEELEFDLPGGPLTATLIEIGRKAQTIVSFRPALVAQRSAPPIRGRYTLRRALELATQGSGLVVEVTQAGAATVAEAEAAAAPGDPAAEAAAPAAPAPAAAASAAQPPVQVVLPRVEVLGLRRDDGLRALRSGSSSRDNTPLADLPQSVSVLTADALALQGGATTTDALRYVPGVTATIDNQGGGGLVTQGARVRGLPALYAVSGMRTIRNEFPADIAFVERIEVPKGPSAVISGVADFGGRGGVVNMVRKQPEPDHKTQATQSLSTQDSGTLRLTGDLGGTLPGDTLWRMIGYGSQSGRSEGGYTGGQGSAGVLGALGWQRGDVSAMLTVQADRRRAVPAPASGGGYVFDGEREFNTPPQPGIVPPKDPDDRILSSSADVELQLDWRIAPDWQMNWKARAEGLQTDQRRFQPFTVSLQRQSRAWGAIMQWSVSTEVATGPALHRLTAGLDLERRRSTTDGVNVTGVEDPAALVTSDITQLRQGLVLQDQVRLGPWRLRLGLQRARVPQYRETGIRDVVGEPLMATNWDLGALVRLTEVVSVYAGSQYAIETDNRQPSDGLVLADGTPFPYTHLRQAQAGAKFDLLGGRLGATVEAFRFRQAFFFDEVAGITGRSTDGIELELVGRPRPELDLSLGVSVLRSSDTVATGVASPASIQLPPTGVPRRSLQMLARYRLPEHWLAQSSAGLGLRGWSSTFVNEPAGLGPYPLPGGAQLDLSLERRFGPWSIQAFVNNVFDRQLHNIAIDTRYLPLYPGRSLALTAAYRE